MLNRSGDAWLPESSILFVYNGYKLVEELDGLSDAKPPLRRYTWQPETLGLDVPLSVFDVAANATYFYTTDANKNVSDLTDSAGNVVAHYEYSPFGVPTLAAGTYAATNPFRFSSEYHDSETNLVYYNYRYYSPALGRWLSRDPIEEIGGINLYGMCHNNPIDQWDINGNISIFVGIIAAGVVGGIIGAITGRSIGSAIGGAIGGVVGAIAMVIPGGTSTLGIIGASALANGTSLLTGKAIDENRLPNKSELIGTAIATVATAGIAMACPHGIPGMIAEGAGSGATGVVAETYTNAVTEAPKAIDKAIKKETPSPKAGDILNRKKLQEEGL